MRRARQAPHPSLTAALHQGLVWRGEAQVHTGRCALLAGNCGGAAAGQSTAGPAGARHGAGAAGGGGVVGHACARCGGRCSVVYHPAVRLLSPHTSCATPTHPHCSMHAHTHNTASTCQRCGVHASLTRASTHSAPRRLHTLTAASTHTHSASRRLHTLTAASHASCQLLA